MLSRYGIALFLMLALLATPLQARVYQYVDESGRKVYVDRLHKVPARYRDQLEVYEEERDQLSPERLDQRHNQRKVGQIKLKIAQQRSQINKALQHSVTPFTFQGNQIIVPVKLVYGARAVQLNLIMDTGASHTVVHQHAIDSLGAQLIPGGFARIADGSLVETQNVVLDRIEIGPYQVENIRAGVLDFKARGLPSHGLLGMDFLLSARYQLDREQQQIIWAPARYQQLKAQLQKLDAFEQTLTQTPPANPNVR